MKSKFDFMFLLTWSNATLDDIGATQKKFFDHFTGDHITGLKMTSR